MQTLFAATPCYFSGQWVVTPAAPAPKAAKGKAAPKASLPAQYAPGPTPNKARKGTWRAYMVATIVKASTPAAATKLHKAKAARAGFKPTQPLDFKWALAQGYIVPAA